jgi:GNAT superfamily N-acetyltransferase
MSESSILSPEAYAQSGFIISTDSQLLDIPSIHRYLSEQSYWAKGRSRELVERSIKHSLCFGVYADNAEAPRQAGFARVVSDYATFAYLADVFILPEYQGRSLGKWLVATMLSHPELQPVRRWTLYTNDAHDLYRRFGFDAEKDPRRFMSYQAHQAKADQLS